MVSASFIKNSLLFTSLSLTINSAFAVQRITNCIKNGDIALTFDDGPSLLYTSRILDILDKENVKATFFVNGMNTCDLKQNQEARNLIKREFDSGHVIASHTYSHPLAGITNLSDKKLAYEINTLNDIIYDIVGVKPAFFRPPLGEYTPQNEVVLEKCGITANILWSLDSEDWNVQYNATQQYVSILGSANPSTSSFIALNHDIQKVTAMKNLQIIIPYIRSLGYRFVTMDECTGLSAYQDGSNPKVNTNVTYTNSLDTTSQYSSLSNTSNTNSMNANSMNSFDTEEVTFNLEADDFNSATVPSQSFGLLLVLSFLFSFLYLI